MSTVILIGNSQTRLSGNYMITPRGYYGEIKQKKMDAGIGQDTMIRSLHTIEKELKNQKTPSDKKWALLHVTHTTVDLDMGNILYVDPGTVSTLYNKINDGEVPTVITDVTMAAPDIRKGALQCLGVEMECYLQDGRVAEMTPSKGTTRTQAGIRRAVGKHPTALFVLGDAPIALVELCDLICKGKAAPAGTTVAPVGFVYVQESKHMAKPLTDIPKLIMEDRKGDSNLAATLVNTILCFNDVEQLKSGRDV